jgi:hypothetical protein
MGSRCLNSHPILIRIVPLVNGLPPDTPTWLPLRDIVYLDGDATEHPSAIVVEDSVQGKWAPGAEILITSHTREWNGHQVRNISKVSNYDLENGFVVLELDAPIVRPTTWRDSKDYAVEVALLSRNIVFEGGPDDNENHGAHFGVMYTPNLAQSLIGVDFQNFGQQGVLGRYPIHFHMLGDMKNSVIAKNTVRQSNQRCIVVHGTNNLLVEDNIAYDTKGHCFMLEDGIEEGNMFLRNLGAQTGIPKKIIPNYGPNGIETDDHPATFWMTNPHNVWIGNVAAGSENSGYWFELLLRGTEVARFPNLDPKSAPLVQFMNNVAHSNDKKGFQTYPTGYIPDSVQEMTGLKSYRNKGQGVFFHLSRNIKFVQGLVADNAIGIDIDRAEGITVSKTQVIGQSQSFANLVATQDVSGSCESRGIDLHTWKHNSSNANVAIEDVTLFGFQNCPKSYPFHIDEDVRTKQFFAYCSLRGVTVDNQANPITFCDAEKAGVLDIYLTDLDGSLRSPSDRIVGSPAALVSNNKDMLRFLDQTKCTANVDSCYNYCEDTCFRSFRFQIDTANTEDFVLKVCSKQDPNSCNQIKGHPKNELLEDFFIGDNRVFLAHVPPGDYNAVFLDPSGAKVWPSFVLQSLEEGTCPKSFADATVELSIPTPEPNACDQLIRNGNIEASDEEAKFWLHRSSGIELLRGQGVGKSNAMAAMDKTTKASLIQYIDTRCLKMQLGRLYEFSAMIKLVSENGAPYFCDTKNCPDIGYHASYDGTFRSLGQVDKIPSNVKDNFQPVRVIFKISDVVALSNVTLVYMKSNVAGKRLVVDDVSIKLVEQESSICQNVINMPEAEPALYWRVLEGGKLSTVTGPTGKPALLFGNRPDASQGIAYSEFSDLVVSSCFTPGSDWKITAQFQLMDRSSGKGVACDPSAEDCPSVRFFVYDADGTMILSESRRSYTSSTWKPDAFNVFQTTVSLPPLSSTWDGTVQKVVLSIRDFAPTMDLVVGTVELSQVSN